LVLAFEREDDAGDGVRRVSEDGRITELVDRLIGGGGDDTSREGRAAEKLSVSVELRMSDNAPASGMREDRSCVEGISGVVGAIEA
jgi:hypothetical protein